jgi:pteridine reductase
VKLAGTVALVTGAAVRVGRAIALELAQAGCDVGLHYHRSQEEARSAAEQIRALGRRCEPIAADLTRAEAPRTVVARVVEALGGLNVLVNNASVFEPMRIEEFELANWERTLQTNLTAPAALCHFAQPHLLAGAAGKIVNICDIVADRPWSSHIAYCASKAGLICLTRSLAKSLAPKVQVNGVSPGIAAFPDDYDEELRARLVARVPLGRAGSPQDIARTVRFLVENGDYITGQIINVDGGRSVV